MPDKLNKLQIRAKVLDVLNSYTSDKDFHSDFHRNNLNTLQRLNSHDFVVEILLKELVAADGIKLLAIKVILVDFTTLEQIENTIWNILQNDKITDSQKGKYLQLLKIMGGQVDVNVLMDCLDDFNSVIDEQTHELLQLATVNPEAQIDFLDFLFSLKSEEQLQLISSMEDDFAGDELTNILVPCLNIKVEDNVIEQIILILAKSKSYLAIKPLKKFIASNSDNRLKKLALKALNQLKSSGIEIDNEEILSLRDKEVCKNSVFYKAYLSQVDGCGNQGIMFSRITDKQQIITFSAVINVTDGIMDCFGLYLISIADFQKVVRRFKENDLVVPIEEQEAKEILDNAENINLYSNNPIPYEYACWNVYLSDISPVKIDYEKCKQDEITVFTDSMYKKLYDTEVFDSWFFEYDDNITVQGLLDYIISIANENISVIYKNIEHITNTIFPEVFTHEKIEEYSQMLKNAGFVFYKNYAHEYANITINLADAIKKGEDRFLKDVIKRSVLQYLANLVASNEEPKEKTLFDKTDTNKERISEERAFEILNALIEQWDNKDV